MDFTDIWSIRPSPVEGSVIRGEGYHITALTDRLFRLEYEPDDRFRDGATQTVIDRAFPPASFEVRERDGRLSIETASVRIA